MNGRLKLLVATTGTVAALGGVALAASSPAVHTGQATQIKQFTAELTGSVNPNGVAISYRFEWGLSNAYGNVSSWRTAGNGTAVKAVNTQTAKLLPGTPYH